MRHDFSAIPEPVRVREGGGTVLSRLYRDIGLAAIAASLGLKPRDLDPELGEAVERGSFYLVREPQALAS